ncbi:thiol oxidoreductase [Alphaproteobacteria bacterium 46_93_T64]|nr:thiol oxidoreductase [Alphaproteobacteria bacterium 46_93_T64]
MIRKWARVSAVGFMVWGLASASAHAEQGRSVQRDDLNAVDLERVRNVTSFAKDFVTAEQFEIMSGGAATSTAKINRNAFSHSSENLDFEGELKFKLGNGLFRKLWVSSPSSTSASDGLGPVFNARSCQRCHLKDGRGHPPENEADTTVSMFLRLSIPPRNASEKASIASGEKALIPEPTYGGQLQDFAIQGVPAEGKMAISYEEQSVALNGGEVVSLRKPTYRAVNLNYGPMDPDVLLSPRVAPPMIGLGLLEAIHPADILASSDPEDTDEDGISGKPSWIGRIGFSEQVLGRFGWKASTPSVLAQTAGAFAGDMGISSELAPRHWGDCTDKQPDCLRMPTGVQEKLGNTEAPSPVLDLVAFYSKHLAVPARRNVTSVRVLTGKKAFYNAGCANCHTPKYVTSRQAEQPEHRFQLIWPYSDLLLHDMGAGLSDNRPVGSAEGSEWRTAPLWGIGLTKKVNGHTYFLHDGRARNLTEAILWHGGEAEGAKNEFVEMSPERRSELIRFLESL